MAGSGAELVHLVAEVQRHSPDITRLCNISGLDQRSLSRRMRESNSRTAVSAHSRGADVKRN